MTYLIAILSVILVITFWRIFLPIALIAAVGLGLLILYINQESDRGARDQARAEEALRKRIAEAKAIGSGVDREWTVKSETDPVKSEPCWITGPVMHSRWS